MYQGPEAIPQSKLRRNKNMEGLCHWLNPFIPTLKTNFLSSAYSPIFYTSDFSLHLSLCNYFFKKKKKASKPCMFNLILLTSLTSILWISLSKKSCSDSVSLQLTLFVFIYQPPSNIVFKAVLLYNWYRTCISTCIV